jgi:hypothetical protein
MPDIATCGYGAGVLLLPGPTPPLGPAWVPEPEAPPAAEGLLPLTVVAEAGPEPPISQPARASASAAAATQESFDFIAMMSGS